MGIFCGACVFGKLYYYGGITSILFSCPSPGLVILIFDRYDGSSRVYLEGGVLVGNELFLTARVLRLPLPHCGLVGRAFPMTFRLFCRLFLLYGRLIGLNTLNIGMNNSFFLLADKAGTRKSTERFIFYGVESDYLIASGVGMTLLGGGLRRVSRMAIINVSLTAGSRGKILSMNIKVLVFGGYTSADANATFSGRRISSEGTVRVFFSETRPRLFSLSVDCAVGVGVHDAVM